MTRWARLHRRLAYTLLLDDRDPKKLKRAVQTLERLPKMGRVGLWPPSLQAEAAPKALKSHPFLEADLPSWSLRALPGLLARRISPRLTGSVITALCYGTPLMITEPDELEALQILIVGRLALGGGIPPQRKLQDLNRCLAAFQAESLSLGEAVIVTLSELEAGKARPKTLQNNLRRQLDRRERWIDRSLERGALSKTLERSANGPVLVLDLLPVIVSLLDGPRMAEISNALVTPTGSTLLGLCPAIYIPPKRLAGDPWTSRKPNQPEGGEPAEPKGGDPVGPVAADPAEPRGGEPAEPAASDPSS